MALIKSVRGFTPKIGKDTFLADNATIIGDVEIGEGCSIWFGAILRGDVNSIRIGNGVNIRFHFEIVAQACAAPNIIFKNGAQFKYIH